MSDIDPDLEAQYNNRAAVPEHPLFLQGWLERSEKFRTSTKAVFYRNLRYGDGPRELLDIFPAEQADAPLHVFIHGGYWQALSKDSFSYLAPLINRAGEAAVILGYDLCPQVSLLQIIHEVRRGLDWLVRHARNYAIDAQRLQITGHSAGGHLAAAMLCRDWCDHGASIQRVNALSGLFDLQPLLSTSVNTALRLDQAAAFKCSPLFQPVPAEYAGTELELYVGELESDAYQAQSDSLAQKWQQPKVNRTRVAGTHHFSVVDAFFTRYYTPLG